MLGTEGLLDAEVEVAEEEEEEEAAAAAEEDVEEDSSVGACDGAPTAASEPFGCSLSIPEI